jgi:hypothetical protein
MGHSKMKHGFSHAMTYGAYRLVSRLLYRKRIPEVARGDRVSWLNQIVFWHWWVLACLLLVLELIRPAFLFLWLGFAAAAAGFLLLVFPALSVAAELAMFGALFVVVVLAWRRHKSTHPDHPR